MEEQVNLKFGERRNATVLFTDMKGFTSISEGLDPEEIDSLMNSIFSAFERIVGTYGGSVEKYIGDALVAVFGVPEIHEDDASRAIHAALDFQRAVERMNGNFSFRTGIHTGLITTGRRGAYDVVTGHAMSVAARMEAFAEAGAILVSESSISECDAEFEFGEPIELALKGKQETVVVRPLLGRRVGLSMYETPFFGRRRLLASAVKSYMAHDGANISGYSFHGPPGIGKTRLVVEFIKRLQEIPGWQAPVLYSRARKFRTLAFASVNDLILGYSGVNAFDSREQIATALCERLKRETDRAGITGTGTDDVCAELADRYAAFIVGQSDLGEGEIFVLIHRLFETLLSSAAESPYCPIIILDNIHLTDRSSADFFRYFADHAKILPFFVFAGRPTDDAVNGVSIGYGGSSRLFPELEPVDVPPLDSLEATEFIRALWAENELDDVVQKVIAVTAGNPLFIEEYVRYARERGVDVAFDDAGLPPTIQTIFLESIEGYEPERQELLKKLAVFEHSFVLGDAVALHGRTEGDPGIVEEALEFFLRQGHLVRDGDAYLFRHELFKHTLYESILNFNKRILHGVVADWICEHDEAVVRPNHLRLLFHLARAGMIDRLKESFFDDVRHIHNPEYLPYIEDILRSTDDDDPDHFRYLFTKYAILFNTRCCDGTEEILQSLLVTCIRSKQPESAARVYQVLCAEFLVRYDFHRAVDYGRRAVRYFQSVDLGHASLQNAYENLASALLFVGRLDENLAILEKMEHTRSGFDSRTSAFTKRYLHLGEYAEAVSFLEQRLIDSDPQETEFWYGGYYLFCFVLWRMHDYPRLEQLCRLLLRAKNQSANYYTEVYTMLASALNQQSRNEAHGGIGDKETPEQVLNPDVLDAFRQAEYYLVQIRSDEARLQPLALLAEARLEAGYPAEAREFAEVALRIAIRIGTPRIHFGVAVLLSEISYRAGRPIDETMFFLTEADGSRQDFPDAGRQDLIMYHYLKSLVSDDMSERKKHLELSRKYLEDEYNQHDRPELKSWFLSTRMFSAVYPERYPSPPAESLRKTQRQATA